MLAPVRADIAGVDEAGRGPLAGPVVAAAVLFRDPADCPAGLDDSKSLNAGTREALFADILACADVGVASASALRIDRMNIRAATLWAMARALDALPLPPQTALIDGRDIVPHARCDCRAIIGGDGREMAIAAASIVAKVIRDRMMQQAHLRYPAYGFDAHKGYGTANHREALAANGPCQLHRMSFRPVREACESLR